MTLSIKNRMTVDLAARPYRWEGVRDQHIREIFGESRTRFTQRLLVILDDPAAEAAMPIEVRRLRRLRAARREARSTRRLGFAI